MQTGHVHVVARGQNIDDLVVRDVGDGRGVAGVMTTASHEAGLIEAERRGLIEAFLVRLE